MFNHFVFVVAELCADFGADCVVALAGERRVVGWEDAGRCSDNGADCVVHLLLFGVADDLL